VSGSQTLTLNPEPWALCSKLCACLLQVVEECVAADGWLREALKQC